MRLRLLPIFFLCLTAAFAQTCPEDDLSASEQALILGGDPPYSRYSLGNTGSSFTLFRDYVSKQTIVTVFDSHGGETVINPSSVQTFLNSNCPGQFSASARGRSLPTARTATPLGTASVAGQAAQGVGVGDFNGDGLADGALVGNKGVSVYLSDPGGATRDPVQYLVNSTTEQGIVVADFNGDGKLDLAILVDGATGTTPGTVAIFLGVGDGTFRPAVYAPLGESPTLIATADFNGDGKPDLVVYGAVFGPGTAQGNYAVLLGKGDGTFAPPVKTAETTTVHPTAIVALDLNGDGKADLLTAGGNQVGFLAGRGDGTLAAPVLNITGGLAPYLAYADLNHDGKIDVVLADSLLSALMVLPGNGDGTFQTPVSYAAPARMTSFVLIPLGDGNTAFMLPDRLSGAVTLALADPQGNINLPALQVVSPTLNVDFPTVLAADLNGDGSPDIVFADGTGVSVELNNRKGGFSKPVVYLAGTNVTGAAIADLNNDGKLDLIVATPSGASVLLGRGDGTFANALPLASGKINGVAVADFNGDGKPDVVATDSNGGFLMFPGKGDGTFLAPTETVLASGAQTGSIASGDFNGDGKPDLLVQYSPANTRTVVFLPGKGDGTFGAPQTLPFPSSQFSGPETFAIGDVNGDGKLDVVAYTGPSPSQVAVLLGVGDGTFQPPVLTSTLVLGAAVTLTDLDGDGKLDVLLGSCCGATEATYLLGNGDGTFQSDQFFITGPGPESFAVANFYGKGRADIAVGGYAGLGNNVMATLSVLYNNFPAPPSPLAVVSAANPSSSAAIAPGSLASAFGADLASGTPGASSAPLPTNVAGTTVAIADAAGATTFAPLIYVSTAQVNFLVPSTVALGEGNITITSGDRTVSRTSVKIAAVAPGLFTSNASGLAAAQAVLVSGDVQTPELVYAITPSGAITANPLSLGGPGDSLVLTLFGTGLQAAGTSGVAVTIGGVAATIQYAGPQGSYVGLDQVNFVVPRSLAGSGAVTIQLTANGVAANPVNVTIQ